jgi:hypothetical protein
MAASGWVQGSIHGSPLFTMKSQLSARGDPKCLANWSRSSRPKRMQVVTPATSVWPRYADRRRRPSQQLGKSAIGARGKQARGAGPFSLAIIIYKLLNYVKLIFDAITMTHNILLFLSTCPSKVANNLSASKGAVCPPLCCSRYGYVPFRRPR